VSSETGTLEFLENGIQIRCRGAFLGKETLLPVAPRGFPGAEFCVLFATRTVLVLVVRIGGGCERQKSDASQNAHLNTVCHGSAPPGSGASLGPKVLTVLQ
jgi:hypothetical protein